MQLCSTARPRVACGLNQAHARIGLPRMRLLSQSTSPLRHTAEAAAAGAAGSNEGRAARVVARVAAGAGDDPLHSGDHWSEKKAHALMQLARIHNVVPSLLLVLVGAWAGTGRSAAALMAPGVWVMGLLTGSLAVSSCVVNDYFDLRVDRRNAPDKPLASGAVTTDTALLLTVALYCSVLIVACFMEDIHLRSIIALSAGATLLYTPVFKKLTAVKNATVATMIALAPLAGALAAGAGEIGVRRLLPATLFAFSGVMFREIVMDLNDLEGDKESGIATLPVLLGKGYALICALGCAFAGGAAALWAATHGAMAAGAPAALAVSGAIVGPAAVVAGALARLTHLAMRIYSSKFDRSTVKWAIDECLKPVGLSLILLAGLMA